MQPFVPVKPHPRMRLNIKRTSTFNFIQARRWLHLFQAKKSKGSRYTKL